MSKRRECFFWYRLNRVDPDKGHKTVVCVCAMWPKMECIHVNCMCTAITFCCENISRLRTSCVRRASAVMLSSQMPSVPTLTTGHIGHRSTARGSADSRLDRCDTSTSTSTLAAMTVRLRPETLAATGEAVNEVCYFMERLERQHLFPGESGYSEG